MENHFQFDSTKRYIYVFRIEKIVCIFFQINIIITESLMMIEVIYFSINF